MRFLFGASGAGRYCAPSAPSRPLGNRLMSQASPSVILLSDGETIHNAFFDRDSVP